mmetsp:Transcript_97519/g.303728  ORF Transcript_97519/g.303728 Transcript_97519/m.303728 type:complete len:805 (+) Transcript_97519:56-2470(+)
MAPESFGELIHQLTQLHDCELATVHALREENERLSDEVRRLRGSSPEGGGHCSEGAPLRVERRKAGTQPQLELQHDSVADPDPEDTRRRRSFPTLIPGMPADLHRPLQKHNTYLVSPPGEASEGDAFEVDSKGKRRSVSSCRDAPELHMSPVVPDMAEFEPDVEVELELPGMPHDLAVTGTRKAKEVDRTTDSMLLRRGSSLILDRAVADIDTQNFSRQKHRFRRFFDLRGGMVFAEDIVRVMKKRGHVGYTLEQARTIIDELIECEKKVWGDHDPTAIPECGEKSDGCIAFDTFVYLVTMPDLLVRVEPEAVEALTVVRHTLLQKGADEVIAKVTRNQPSAVSLSTTTTDFAQTRQIRRIALLNLVVGITVVMSIATLGVSMDLSPDWPGWLALEATFGVVFVFEFVLKISMEGWRAYWWGRDRRWNWFDFTITLCTLIDLALSLVTIGMADKADLTSAKLTLVLRGLRLARIARLVKLLHTPILSGLASMLAGFAVGIPCMCWVLVLLSIVFYVLGMVFRQVVGPPSGSSRIEVCGTTGDNFTGSDDPLCQAHILYGEEFFGTLRVSIFTVFRCVLGDCSSKAGKSLTAAFSAGYGFAFDSVYCGGMILVVVGLFNIIAAIFVETTISGLKFNNVQRRYARMYESRYVQSKLEALVLRVQELHAKAHPDTEPTEEFVLTEEEFNEAMQDDGVSLLLEDLDICLANRVGLFDMFDCDNNGLVTVAEFVATLLKVRGEPQKSDMIASWVALRSLNERFQNFERLVFENQKRMLEYQRDLAGRGVCSNVVSVMRSERLTPRCDGA